MLARVPIVRASTVRIHVGGKPSGSGFVVRANGLIATCFHVVQQVTPGPGGAGATVSYQPQITVELPGQVPTPATVHPSCANGQGLVTALQRDFTILQIAPAV